MGASTTPDRERPGFLAVSGDARVGPGFQAARPAVGRGAVFNRMDGVGVRIVESLIGAFLPKGNPFVDHWWSGPAANRGDWDNAAAVLESRGRSKQAGV